MADSSVFNCRVWIVEDDSSYVILLKRCLTALGVRSDNVRAYSHGEQVVDAFRREPEPPSLVLLDHNLPRRTGLEVLEWIRSQPDAASVPLFMLSTGTESRLIQEAYRLGVRAYFIKPLQPAHLLKILERILVHVTSGKWDERPPGSVDPSGLFTQPTPLA